MGPARRSFKARLKSRTIASATAETLDDFKRFLPSYLDDEHLERDPALCRAFVAEPVERRPFTDGVVSGDVTWFRLLARPRTSATRAVQKAVKYSMCSHSETVMR